MHGLLIEPGEVSRYQGIEQHNGRVSKGGLFVQRYEKGLVDSLGLDGI